MRAPRTLRSAGEPFPRMEGAIRNGPDAKDSPAGVIFMCSRITRKDCFYYKVFGMPASQRGLVERIAPGTMLFLYDIDLKELDGIFEAISYGGMDLEPEAFREFKGSYPAQVFFNIYRECFPLKEDDIRHAIRENYSTPYKFSLVLTDEQVKRLLQLFQPVEPPRKRLDGPRPLSERDLIRAPPRGHFDEEERSLERQHSGYPYRQQPSSIPHEDFYPPEGRDHPRGHFDEEERREHFRERSLERQHSGYPYRQQPSIPHEDFYPPEGRDHPGHDHPIPHEGFYSFEERVPPIPREEFYPTEDGYGVLHEGSYPPIPRDRHHHPLPHEHLPPGAPRNGCLPIPHEERYPPIPHEERYPPISREERYPPVPHPNRYHLNQPTLPHGGGPLNLAPLPRPITMEEVDQLALKYIQNDPRFIGNSLISPLSSTQPDDLAGKRFVGSQVRRSLRPSRWDQERNALPAVLK